MHETSIISHRGNLNGPSFELENSPKAVDKAISLGFEVEVDIWSDQDGQIGLGHDSPEFWVGNNWLLGRSNHLWVHCKNRAAVLTAQDLGLHWFFHRTDDYTQTSHGLVWVFPGVEPVSNSIVLDVADFGRLTTNSFEGVVGICTDWPVEFA